MSSFEWPSEGSGNAFTSIELDGSTSGALTITVPAVVSSYTLVFPDAQGTGALVDDGSGNLSWSSTAGITFGNLTDVGTDGITVTGGTGAVRGSGTSLSQHVADSTHNGYLSSTDWSTFNGKQAALSITNLTDAGTDGITITNGTGAVIGASPVTIAQHVADSTHNGYLSSTDWSTFNSKQAALSISNLTDVGTDGITITNGTGAVIGAAPVTLSQHVADSTHNGYLSSTDWSTFNGKQASGSYITALTGDGTASGPGSVALTLATVNSNVGSFTNASVTVNAKGLVTAASSGSAPFSNPMTTGGDLIYGGAAGTPTRLANGGSGRVLTSSGGTGAPFWSVPAYPSLTSVASTIPSITRNFSTIGSAGYGAMSGGSVTLPIGTWQVDSYYSAYAGTGVGCAMYNNTGLYAANGTDANSVPAALSTIATVVGPATFVDVASTSVVASAATSGGWSIHLTTIVTVTSSQTIFAVPRTDFSAAGTAQACVYIVARQIFS